MATVSPITIGGGKNGNDTQKSMALHESVSAGPSSDNKKRDESQYSLPVIKRVTTLRSSNSKRARYELDGSDSSIDSIPSINGAKPDAKPEGGAMAKRPRMDLDGKFPTHPGISMWRVVTPCLMVEKLVPGEGVARTFVVSLNFLTKF